MIDGLVAEGKYLWQAFQSGNDIGRNTNNNTVGGYAFDAEYCAAWMSQRCNTQWVNERAITVQFDSSNVNVSIASFLIVRPAYAWIGYGAGYYRAKWNDVRSFSAWRPSTPARALTQHPPHARTLRNPPAQAFLWDVGLPLSECRNGSVPGTFERDWT